MQRPIPRRGVERTGNAHHVADDGRCRRDIGERGEYALRHETVEAFGPGRHDTRGLFGTKEGRHGRRQRRCHLVSL